MEPKYQTEIPRISLKAARVNAELHQKDAARALHVSEATIANWEKGKSVPDALQIREIERVYGYPSDLIFFKRNFTLSENHTTS